jgi:hypothetical protein
MYICKAALTRLIYFLLFQTEVFGASGSVVYVYYYCYLYACIYTVHIGVGLIRNGVFNFSQNTIIVSCWM